jgi:hypothetical protein
VFNTSDEIPPTIGVVARHARDQNGDGALMACSSSTPAAQVLLDHGGSSPSYMAI